MADVIKFSLPSASLSSSLITSIGSSLNSIPKAIPLSHDKINKRVPFVGDSSSGVVSGHGFRPRKQFESLKLQLGGKFCVANPYSVHAAIVETEQPKWWERNAGPNMIDIHSTQEFLGALSQAGDRLVIVEFYGTWCASCKALFPKLCRTAKEHPEILFLKVNFDENKPMCKNLNVKVLPYFHFYRGADGLLESFSCSLAKFQKIKDAIEMHNTARCSIGPTNGVGNLAVGPAVLLKDNAAG